MRHPRALTTLTFSVLGVLLLNGCSATTDDTDPEESTEQSSETPDTSSEDSGEAQADAQAAEIPDTELGNTAQWIIDQLNGDEDITAEDWDAALSEEMKDEVPAEDLAEMLTTQFQPAAPWTPTSYEEAGDSGVVVNLTPSITEPLQMQLSLDDEGLINMLLFTPQTPEHEPAESLDEVQERVEETGLDISFEVSTVDTEGAKETMLSQNEDQPMPLGSIFKLYVLLAVDDAVSSGELNWTMNSYSPMRPVVFLRELCKTKTQEPKSPCTMPLWA